MENELFGDDQITTAIDPAKNYVEELVGEGKKFKDFEALARSKIESDAFIERLKNEQKGLREELSQRQKVTELLDRLNSNVPPQVPPTRRDEPDTERVETLSPEKIDQLINQQLMQREQNNQSKNNMDLVRQELIKQYGDTYQSILKQKTEELGMTKEQMMQMITSSPKAALALVMGGQVHTLSPTAPPQTRINTQLTSSRSGVRNESYYKEMRKRDPVNFWSPKTQTQLHKDALAQGESFFS